MHDKRRRVVFPGHGTFWFLDDGDGTGPLAHLEHCDEDGQIVTLEAALSDSYAHVFDGGIIRRYRKQVGTLADLQDEADQPVVRN